MLRRDGTGQADATVGDSSHRDPSQRLGDGPLYVPSPVCAPAAAPALFRTADPAVHQPVYCLTLLVLYPVYNHHEDPSPAESQLKLGISRAKTPRPQRSENNGQ